MNNARHTKKKTIRYTYASDPGTSPSTFAFCWNCYHTSDIYVNCSEVENQMREETEEQIFFFK